MDNEKALAQFKIDVARFSGNYKQFLIVAMTDDQFMFKSTDDTWGMGAALRFLNIKKEHDKMDEQHIQDGEE
jgi:hypothetical protein